MYLYLSESSDEFAKIRLTLGRGIKQVKDRRELMEAIGNDSEHHITTILIGSSIEYSFALAIAEEMRVSHPTVGVILLRKKLEPSLLTQVMSSGVRDVVGVSDPEAIVAAARRSDDISRRQKMKSNQSDEVKRLGKVIVIHGAKDGLGVTTIAANLAVALAHDTSERVCLIDSMPITGDLGIKFRREPNRTWVDLLDLEVIDDEALHATWHEINPNLNLMLAPREVRGGAGKVAALPSRITYSLQERFSYVLIDSDSRIANSGSELLKQADLILIVAELDLASLKNLKLRIKELESLSIKESQIALIANRSDLKTGVHLKDVPELVGMPLAVSLPWDIDVMRLSNEGQTMYEKKSNSSFSIGCKKIATFIKEFGGSVETSKSKIRVRKSA